MALSEWNIHIFRIINDLGKRYMYLNPIFEFMAEYTVYLLVLGMIAYWFTRSNSNRMMVMSALIAFVTAEAAGKIAGQFHSNHQPFAELPDVNKLIEKSVNNSFPSDHTILFFSVCVSFWLFRKKNGFLWMMLAFSVALSRIWVGVHYPADIAAGAIIGMISAVTVYWIVPKSNFIQQLLEMYEKGERSILPSKTKSKDL
ncbi:MAG TPA: undecaprenyl-diphosphatase [Bacillus sp. (in: firmicutes)]|nr:undecaprenyl-diphosphatase [Bacillus sp. (in: firmicutes)]